MNQNIEPLIITLSVPVQAGTTSDYVNVYPGMGKNEQLNVWGLYCRIENGDVNIGDINNDNVDEITYTDIEGIYLPSRPEDFATLPLCCNPRPGSGEFLYLWLYKDKRPILRNHYISLALFNNLMTQDEHEGLSENPQHDEHHTKILLFEEPLAILPSEKFRIKVQNSNPVTTTDETTYSKATISFLCEIVDKRATLALLTGK